MPETSLHRIPDNVSYQQAALTEPLAVAAKAILERSKVKPGDVAVVLGCGPIGMMAAEAIKASGARWVMITGTNADEKGERGKRNIAAGRPISLSEED
ncbi:MAG: hypothetical protein GY786_04320 [Proteobacteria bacterium]|nr:hypothetical protein [Pseudomonadota bacterium]